VTIWHDRLEAVIGSRRVYLPGLHELHALGFIEARRLPIVARSEGWRRIKSKAEAAQLLVREAGRRYRRRGSLRCLEMQQATGGSRRASWEAS
jgi:hypothetical protein